MPAHPLPIVTNGFKIENLYHSGDATFANIYYIQSGTGVDAATAANDFINAYDVNTPNPSMRALHSSDITLDGLVVTPLDGITPSIEVPRSAGVHGTGASPCVAANASLVITWETGIRGRNRRGRTFLAGLPNASLESGGGKWGTAIVTDANLWVLNFLNALVAADYQLLQVSQRSTVSPGDHVNPVTTFVPRVGVGTQRRRTERNKP